LFVVSHLIVVGAQSGFVDQEVGDVLRMVDRRAGVVDLLLTLAIHSVESKLNFVEAVTEAKQRKGGSFSGANNFILSLCLFTLVEGSYGYKVLERFQSHEVVKSNAHIHFIIEGNLVKSLFKIGSVHFIVHKCLLGHEVQVLLECLANHLAFKCREFGFVTKLTLQKRKEAVRNTNHREVLALVHVVLLHP